MAEKNLPVNEAIELGYQAPNKLSGLSGVDAPIAEIYLPDTKEKDSNYPDVKLIEVGNTGTYRGEFTPLEQGEWQVIMHKADGDGQITRKYSVGAYNVHGVGAAIADVDADVATLDGKVDALEDISAADVNAEVDQALIDADVAKDTTVAKDDTVAKTGAGSDTLETLSDQLDGIGDSVGALDTPPQAF